MIHPTNPDAVRVKRDGPRGWHWVAKFDPAVHVLFERDPLDHDGNGKKGGSLPQPEEAPAVEPVAEPAPPAAPKPAPKPRKAKAKGRK